MSIFPAVDLVTDVAQAADPQKRNAAVSRLGELSSARLRADDAFTSLVDRPRRSGASEPPQTKAPVVTTIGQAGPRMPKVASAASAAETFEAFVIQTCLETILPKAEEGQFGHGAAGSAWRSMLAEQISAQISKAGGLGMRSMLIRNLEHREGAGASAAQVEAAG
jgi:hypothetical protein